MTAVSADVTKLTKRERPNRVLRELGIRACAVNISDMDGSLPTDGAFNYESFLGNDILSALDFPMEDIDDSVEDNDWDSKFQDIEPPPNIDQLLGPGIFSYDDKKKHTNLSTPYEQMYQPQFPSVTCETIRSKGSLRNDDHESIGSCAAQFEPKFEKRTRSKLSRSRRANPVTFSTQFIPSTSSNSSATENLYHWDACKFDIESSRTEDMLNTTKRKQKKKTGKLTTDEPGESREAKRCTHCQVTKTPQWREGPLGPKTLCNACGVRYRSGRLFPEYRPAASPTFVAAVHSNSHKKVIELRSKGCQEAVMGILSSAR
ncbi:hypothetical protein ACFX2I_006531 [Malus domestica]|uniref:GATA transcription factor 11-like n=1 Tax=Malus sylvestris TaxID=3752 RepID=UPI0010AA410F|nr:GATA transcription factor 11-like isoform X1 [Malus domestica]XP_050110517.1 GATA transcription factor 11-like [Malus sylvestris]